MKMTLVEWLEHVDFCLAMLANTDHTAYDVDWASLYNAGILAYDAAQIAQRQGNK